MTAFAHRAYRQNLSGDFDPDSFLIIFKYNFTEAGIDAGTGVDINFYPRYIGSAN
jgi:hypothetical protein